MKTVVALMVSMVMVGCAAKNDVDVNAMYAVTNPTITLPSEVVSAAKEAWMATGHEDPTMCEMPRFEVVDFDTFRAWCHKPSCAEGTNKQGTCAHACTQIDVANRGTFIVWAGDAEPAASGTKPVSLDIVLTHEMYHVWEHCTTGNGDYTHADTTAWSTKDGADEKNLNNSMDLYREMSKANGLDKIEMAVTAPSK